MVPELLYVLNMHQQQQRTYYALGTLYATLQLFVFRAQTARCDAVHRLATTRFPTEARKKPARAEPLFFSCRVHFAVLALPETRKNCDLSIKTEQLYNIFVKIPSL